jgi:phosphate:Na+ symporter
MTILHSSFTYTIAGIAFFMFGLGLISENLQKLAANRINELLSKVSTRPVIGVMVGVLLTVIIQSSGAVTSMLVGLASAGVVKLAQVMSLIIGTTIGTTVTVQLLSLNLAQYGLPLFTLAFSIYFLTSHRFLRQVMQVFMGFGLIFWGLELIGIGTEDLRKMDFFVTSLNTFKNNPFLTVIVSSVFTAVVHSSAVTIGFVMTLAMSGQLSLVDSLYWVYGANIGTTATALIASAGGNAVGKQVALAHFLYKLVSVGMFFYFTEFFASFISGETPMRAVANSHAIFNIVAALLFYPFINLGVKFIESLIPNDNKEFGVKYLDRSSFESSSVALAHAQREAMRMADIVISMIKDSLLLFEKESDELLESIRKRDDKVDILNREINIFLSQQVDSPTEISQDIYRIMSFVTDMECVGDVIDNSLVELSKKKHNLKLTFSHEGWEELRLMSAKVLETAELSISAFQLRDLELGAKVIYLKREIRKLEKSLRQKHLERLVLQKESTIHTSAIHLDVLSEYRRITGLVSNHVYAILKDSDQYNLLPRKES